MKTPKVFTIDIAVREFNIKSGRLNAGDMGRLTRSYTGDSDRQGQTITITGTEIRDIESGHFAVDELGCTSEEVYTVEYGDGKTNVLWPEEVERVS